MKYVNRIVGNLVFLGAFVLSGWLAWQFHGAQDIAALGVSALALVLSAFGLVFARHSWSERAIPEFLLGISLWIVGAGAFTITELGYWFSSYNERHAVYQQEKKTKIRAEGLKDQDWQALTTGQVPLTAAQIEADLEAKKFNPIYARSVQCTDATLPASRAFCGDISKLKSQLAQAQRREQLEGQFKSASAVKPDSAKESYVHDVFAQAEVLAGLLGITEKEAATIVILSTWLLLMLARDTGLLIANPMGRRRMAAVKAAQKPQEAPKAAPVSVAIHAPGRPAGLPDVIEKAQAKPMVEAPVDPEPETPPDGDGTPKEEPQETAAEVKETEPTNLVNFPVQTPPKQLSKRELAKEKKERIQREKRETIEDFVVAKLDTEHPDAEIVFTPKGNRKSGGTEGKFIYRKYASYCKDRGIIPVGNSLFGKYVNEFVESARNDKRTFYGAVVRQEAKRKVA